MRSAHRGRHRTRNLPMPTARATKKSSTAPSAAGKPSRNARPAKPLTIQDYLQKTLTSRVYDVAIESPLDEARSLSRRLGHHVFFKREDKQPVFSFKLRGAYNKMAQLSRAQLARGVICASAGNHAQGVAMGARRLGCQATVVMPVTTPQVKIDAVAHFGGDNVKIVLHGESYSDAALHAKSLERKHGLTFVPPFDDPDVVAGQGTVAMEILRQHAGPIDAVFVAIGGGGLISGVAAYIKAVRPEIKVIGVQMSDSDAMLRSVKAKGRVTLSDVGLFSDGTAVKLVGEETLRLTSLLVDDIVTVNTDAVCAAIKDIYQDTRSIVEPAAQRHRVQLPHLRRQGSARLRRPDHERKGRVEADRQGLQGPGLSHGGPHARRVGQDPPAPHGGWALRPGRRRAALQLHLPRAPGRPDGLPQQPAAGLEHQLVPLPQPGGRLWPHPDRVAGAQGRGAAHPEGAGQAGLRLRRRNPQPGLPVVPALNGRGRAARSWRALRITK